MAGVEPVEEPVSLEDIEQTIEEAALDGLSQALGYSESCYPNRFSSAMGRFVLEMPPSDPVARVRYLRDLLKLGETDKMDPRPRASLFERTAKGTEILFSTFRLEKQPWYVPEILVGENGYVTIASYEKRLGQNVVLRTIYRPDGTAVCSFSLEDLLTPGDLEVFSRFGGKPNGKIVLDDESEHLVISLQWDEVPRRIELDLATGLPLVPPRDLLPRFRADSGVYGIGTKSPRREWRDPVCVGERIDFDAAHIVREPSSRFAASALLSPLPEYTEIARRARLQGTVDVEVVVSETGKVLCARVTDFPMGLPAKVEAVVLGWSFQPVLVDGKPVRTVGRIAIHFHEVDPVDVR
jgi:TonB family protein